MELRKNMRTLMIAAFAAMATTSALAVTVYSEDFDAGLAASTFTVVNDIAGSPVVWDDMAASANGNYATAAGQTNALTADSDWWGITSNGGYRDSFDTTAFSSTFSLVNMMNATLSFDVNFQKNGTNGNVGAGDEDRLEVMARSGNGAFTILDTIASDIGGLFVNNTGSNLSYSLAAFDGLDDVQVAYRFVDLGGPGTWEWYAQIDNVNVDAEAVPEPATMAILAGVAALVARRRKA